jgi:tetrahydromethanopterin S-methyltransferase subunit G
MSVMKAVMGAGLVVASVALVAARQAPPAQPDVLPALLEEVKGLRAAMEQMASAGPRIQLFSSRLQLQETRINNMIRRLDTVRDSLAEAQKEVARLQGQQQHAEATLAAHDPSMTPERREDVEKEASFVIGEVKRTIGGARATVDRYAAEEAQLTADIGTEQARWTEINGRLDELERQLAKK